MKDTIQLMSLEDVMGDRFGRYSKYVIQDRALPDARDGLKPVQRRILYAMYTEGNFADRNYRKSAKTVGTVIGNFHPHGDSSVYDAMVRMSQDWKMRHILIDMQGNNGSVDGDPAAAMRYTEARLSKIAHLLLQDIEKNTVEFVMNFDDTDEEPTVLPARYPNLLVNGSVGISAGYATDIPPHNLGEVIDATLYLLDHHQANVDELMQFIQGPDFPTGGIIQGLSGIKQAYETGRGRIVVRSKTEIDMMRGGRERIIITDLPYEVNKANLVKKIDELRIDKKIEGISEIRDETDREGQQIVIELKKEVNAQGILNYLFKHTDLQVAYNFNMVAIDERRPKLMSLRQLLLAYIEHQKQVIYQRSVYELNRAKQRMHIVEGLIKAFSILDKVIRLIRNSENKSDAKINLQDKFDFTEQQAEAIVMLQLYRLTNMDILALQKEFDNLKTMIHQLEKIINNSSTLVKVLKKELLEVKKVFDAPRRSVIEAKIEELKIEKEVLIASEDVIVTLTKDGYIKRTSTRSYIASKGIEDLAMKDTDILLTKVDCNTQDVVVIFTKKGYFCYVPVHLLPDIKWKDLGQHLSSICTLNDDDEVLSLMLEKQFVDNDTIVMSTKNGMIKQTLTNKFKLTRHNKASMAINLKEDDELISVYHLASSQLLTDVIVTTNVGYVLRYNHQDIPVSGLRTAGVKSITLKDNEYVVGASPILIDNHYLVTLSQRGAAKRMKLTDFDTAKRAQRGLVILKELKSQPHRLVFAKVMSDNMTLELVSEKQMIKHVEVKHIRLSERYTNGSIIVDTTDFGEITLVHEKVSE